jgi:membrane-associated phospholipid phosphatase
MFSVMMMLTDPFWPFWMLPVVLLIAGLTGTARLLREAHLPSEVYAGYLAGAICQLAGWYIAG